MPYPPKTIHQLLCGLQRYMLDCAPDAPKFMDQKDVRFRDIRGTCDTVFHSKGVGADTRHTPIITADEEDRLWSSGVFSDDNPQSLQYAVFFYVGKVFCIRGGEEQRRLGPSQLVRSNDPDCYTYIEHGSKNRTGGLLQLRVDNKTVPCYAIPESSPRCLVHLLDTYLAKLPSLAFEKDILYLRPKASTPKYPKEPWYNRMPVGKNTLASYVKTMCQKAGIQGSKTNHSLRASGATSLFTAGVPEKIIQKTTGHKSLSALRDYERVSTKQHQAVSRVLMNCETYEAKSSESATYSSQLSSSTTDMMSGMFKDCQFGNVTVNVNPSCNN